MFPFVTMSSGKTLPVCYRKCASGERELWQSERLGRGQPRSRLLQSRDAAAQSQHDATGLDPDRTTCTGNIDPQVNPPNFSRVIFRCFEY